MGTVAEEHKRDLERLKSLRYIDDDFMTVCLADYYEALAKRARYFKQDEKGVAAMCKIMEDMRKEAALDNARDTARRMIKKGKMSLEEIADYVPILSLDELKQLETEIMQMA